MSPELPGPRVVYECVVDECDWTHDQTRPTLPPATTVAAPAGAGFSEVVRDLVAEGLRRADVLDQKALLAHMGGHTTLEFVRTIARLHTELRQARQEVAEALAARRTLAGQG